MSVNYPSLSNIANIPTIPPIPEENKAKLDTAYNIGSFTAAQLRALTSEDKRSFISIMPPQRIFDVLHQELGSQPTEQDMASFLHEMEAGYEVWENMFDDGSLQRLVQQGILTPTQETIFKRLPVGTEDPTLDMTDPTPGAKPPGIWDSGRLPGTKGIQGAIAGVGEFFNGIGSLITSEAPTAPAALREREEAEQYVEGWGEDQRREGALRIREGDLAGGVQLMLGSYPGTLGRWFESSRAEMKAWIGQHIAFYRLQGLGPPPKDEAERVFLEDVWRGHDKAGVAVPVREMQDLFDRDAEGWPTGFKHGAENAAEYFLDLLLPPLRVGKVAKEAAMATRTGTRRMSVPIVLGFTKGVEQIPGVIRAARIAKRPWTYLRSQPVATQVVVFERNIEDIVDDVWRVQNPEQDVAKAARLIENLADPRPLSALPVDTFMTDINPNRIAVRQSVTDTINTVRKASETVQGPLSRINLDLYKVDPADGTKWSLNQVKQDAVAQMTSNVAIYLGLHEPSKGMYFQRAIAQWKKNLGWSFLYSNPAFYLIQYFGGMAVTFQRHGRKTFMTASNSEWFRRTHNYLNGLEIDSIEPVTESLFTAQTNLKNLGGLAAEVGGGIKHGPRGLIEKIDLSRLPLIGDHFAPIDIQVPRFLGQGWKSHPDDRTARLPGLSGAVKFMTGVNEATQHRLNQIIVGRDMMKEALGIKLRKLDFGSEAGRIRTRLLHSFHSADDDVVTEAGLRKFMSQLADESGNTFRVITRPRHVIPEELLGPNTKPFLERRLDALEKAADKSGRPITARHIDKAWSDAAVDIMEQAEKDIALAFSEMPGAFGSEAHSLLQIYKKQGMKPNDKTVSIIADMLNRESTLHDISQQIMEFGAKSAQNMRAKGVIGLKASEDMTEQLAKLGDRYQAVHINKSRRSMARSGEVQKRTAKLRAAKARNPSQAEKLDAAHNAWEEAGRKALDDKTYKEFMEITNEIVPLQFKRHIAASIQTSIRKAEVDKVLIPGSVKFSLKDDPLLVTKRIMVDVADELVPVHSKWRAELAKVRRALGDEASVWEQYLKAQGDAYVRAAAKYGYKVTNPAQRGITRANFKAIVRAIDAENGNKDLMRLLDDRNIGSFFLAEAEKVANRVRFSQKAARSAWENPYVVADSKVTLKQLQQAINETFNEGRSYMRSESAKVLFPYTKNNFHAIMDAVFPFSYWSLKFAVLQAEHALTHPGQVAAFLKIMSAWQEETANLPDHFRGTIPLVTLPNGTQVRVNIAAMTVPVFGGEEFLSLVTPGNDEEFNQNVSAVQEILNGIGLGSVNPGLALMIEPFKHWADLEGKLGEGAESIFGDFGMVPNSEQVLSNLGGKAQDLLIRQGAAGNLPFPQQITVFNHMLTRRERQSIGYVIQDWLANGRMNEVGDREHITELQAREALFSIRSADASLPGGELALAALKEWGENKSKYTAIQFVIRGFQPFDQSYRDSLALNAQYRELRGADQLREAERLLKNNPSVVFGWAVNDELVDQDKALRVHKYWSAVDKINATYDEFKGKLDVYDRSELDRLEMARREEITNAKSMAGVSDKDLAFTRKADTPEKRMKNVIDIFRDQIQYHMFDSPAEYFEMRDGWVKRWVDPNQVELMEQLLVRYQSLPEAIWDVYGDMYVRKYLRNTENMTADAKELYLTNNALPSIEEIAQTIHAKYKDEDGQPRWDIDTILNKISDNKGLSVEGYLNVSLRSKMDRVEATVNADDPYTFRSASGVKITDTNLEEFRTAVAEYHRWLSTKDIKDKHYAQIDSIISNRDTALARFSVADILANRATETQSHFRMLLKIAYDELDTAKTMGAAIDPNSARTGVGNADIIYPWTELVDKYFSTATQNLEEDFLRLWQQKYFEITPDDFKLNEEIQWDEFRQARELVMEHAILRAKDVGISRGTVQKYLWKNKNPNELVAIWWENRAYRKATEEWFAEDAKRTPELWASIARKYNASSTVKDEIKALKREFPWITNNQWVLVYNNELPNWAEYFRLREWKEPTTYATSGSRTSIATFPRSGTNIPSYGRGSTNIPSYGGGSTNIPRY